MNFPSLKNREDIGWGSIYTQTKTVFFYNMNHPNFYNTDHPTLILLLLCINFNNV